MQDAQVTSLDPAEVAKFAKDADHWWAPDGPFKPLHEMTPLRTQLIKEAILAHFGREAAGRRPLAGLTIADLGCGGGLACEPMARLGAAVTGLDAAEESIAAARAHAGAAGLVIDYRAGTAEALAAGEPASRDAALALEIVEHVADLDAFLTAAAALIRPGGLLIVTTINRTALSYALAIVAAERVLKLVPEGSHAHDRLVKPEELAAGLRRAGLAPGPPIGMRFSPLQRRWERSTETAVNYLMSAAKPA